MSNQEIQNQINEINKSREEVKSENVVKSDDFPAIDRSFSYRKDGVL